MIRAEHITKKFGGQVAVNQASFQVPAGKTLVLLGTSGSGKTTTLRMINRLIEPDEGTIFIDDKNVLEQDAAAMRRNMGYVLQSYGLFPHYTVAENIAIVPRLLGWSPEKIQQRTDELLAKLHLEPADYQDAYPSQLSGGQKQRVGLARALAAYPPILLMDEPFGALDPITRTSIRKEFKELDEFKRKTIILVTHDVQEAFELGDIICIMDQGNIIQSGSPQDLLFHPANEFVKNFLDAQRLQLELKSVQLKMIAHQLPPAINSQQPFLPGNQSLWEALEQLTSTGDPQYVVHEADNTLRQLRASDIYEALTSLKLQD